MSKKILEKPLFDILALEEKKCQNAKYDWHVMPKSRFKPDPFFHGEKSPNRNTFVISTTRKPFRVGIFCYHCAITFIGNLIKNWKNAGATDEQIASWVPSLHSSESAKEKEN